MELVYNFKKSVSFCSNDTFENVDISNISILALLNSFWLKSFYM